MVARADTYYFGSFVSQHDHCNLGCCIVLAADPEEANRKALALPGFPEECNSARWYGMDQECFQQQGMELDRFYTADEMSTMGFQKDSEAN